MDRARAAGFIQNNFIQNLLLEKKMKEHKEKLAKIKNRAPGSSPKTLDNLPPDLDLVQSKGGAKAKFAFMIERENRVLLKRISHVLTAPPEITDKDYQDMKKLVIPKGKGYKEVYEKQIIMEKNKAFYEHLHKLKPVYSRKKWEAEYAHQKFNQKFMREVTYKRPKGFVDPFAPKPDEKLPPQPHLGGPGPLSKSDKRTTGTIWKEKKKKPPTGKKSSSSHVGRIRGVKKSRESAGGDPASASNTASPGKLRGTGKAGDSAGSVGESYENDFEEGTASQRFDRTGDSYDDDGFIEDDEEVKVELYGTQRVIRVTEPRVSHHFLNKQITTTAAATVTSEHVDSGLEQRQESADGDMAQQQQQQQQTGDEEDGYVDSNNEDTPEPPDAVYFIKADLQCWLVDEEVLVLSVISLDQEQVLEAEAEIGMEDLAAIRGLDSGDSLLNDMEHLKEIAEEIVINIELKVEDGVARLILNLATNDDGDYEEEERIVVDGGVHEDGHHIRDGGEHDAYHHTNHSVEESANTALEEEIAFQMEQDRLAFEAGMQSIASEDEIEQMLLAGKNRAIIIYHTC